MKKGGDTVSKTSETKELENKLWNHTKKRGTFGCFEVTINWYGKERVDYITYNTKGIWRCYEVKASKSDFNSNARVSFLGHFNHYVMPKALFEEVKHEIPGHIGVYVPKGNKLVSVKNAKKQELGVDEQILKDSMIRSLYRESEKVITNNDVLEVDKLRKKLVRAERKAFQNYKQHMDLLSKLYEKYGDDWKEGLK